MKAKEFSESNACDKDWVEEMGDLEVINLSIGQKGSWSGFPATVLRHYRNGMYEVKTAGGTSVIDAKHFIAA